MRHWVQITAACAAAALAACAALPAPAPAPPLRFGVIGDQTGTDDLDAAYVVMAQGVDALNAHDLAIVLHTGDLLESSREPDQVRADYARASAILNRLRAPWMLTPGDHDVNPGDWRPASPDRNREALFRSLYSQHEPAAAERLHRSVDIDGVRFIALNAHDQLHVDPRWGVTFLAAIGEPQLAWLETALAAPPVPRATVVFLHQPLWYNWAAWAPVHQTLARHDVDLVIAGHFHYGQVEPELDGVRYLVVGATGGSTKHGSPNAGDRHHVTVFEIGSDSLNWDVIPLAPEPGADADLSPRRDMDRVQAVSSMLWSLDARRPDRTPPTEGPFQCLGPGLLGNPIDLPLMFSVHGPDAAPAAGAFAPSLCAADDGACRAPPGAGVSSSNLSSVALRPATAPTWRAAQPHPRPQVAVTATFTADGETYTLRADANLGPCPVQ